MILLLLLWGLYFFLHSLLAANSVKHWLQRVSGFSAQSYRFGYNLFNFFALGLILWLHYKLVSAPVYTGNISTALLGVVLTMAGFILMILSAKEYQLASFLGLRKETLMPLQINGLHRYMRHPLYSGTLLLCIGICIAFPLWKNWSVLCLMVVYLFIGMWLEEKKLIEIFGEEYINYSKKVKRLIPGIL